MTHAVASLLASIVWALLGALFLWRLDEFAHRWLGMRQHATALPDVVEIPDDLVGLAMAESEKWAQDSALKTIRERYETFKDWNKVRAAVGVAEVDG